MGRVLVVEDNPLILKALSEVLQAAGHEVVQAADGFAALYAIEHLSLDVTAPDFVLLDMQTRASMAWMP